MIDTKKPTIKESESLKIEKGKSYDLKKGIIIKDNSNQYNLTIDTNDLIPIKLETTQFIIKQMIFPITKRLSKEK